MHSHPRRIVTAFAAASVLALGSAQGQAGSVLVDRGLPGQNLNNAAGADRSNVAWAFNGDFLAGDNFTLDETGDAANPLWNIDKLSVWMIGGEGTLGDRFSSLSLFLGSDGSDVPNVASADLTGNATNNSNVTVTQVTYPGTTLTYQGQSGDPLNIWQIDFTNLGAIAPGTNFFALAGEGGPLSFMHASNAGLSGTPQDGADGFYNWFSGNASSSSIALGGEIDSEGDGWDKSSDINVTVEATAVPSPTAALASLSLMTGLMLRRRSRQTA